MSDSSGWRIFFATFVSVFIAELGDKTQLATFGLSSSATSGTARMLVFAGASLALVSTSAIGVAAGAWVSRAISPALLTRGAGVLFVLLGVWMLVRKPV
jgi:putative Ca2+/H+ antiporter (TMEM165/GDT1 family)